MNKKDRIAGGIVGLLVGDALGVPYEFHSREQIPGFDKIEFEPPSDFQRSHEKVPIGTWSDDGAQALVLLDSLLTCGKFDINHFSKGLIAWFDRDFMAVDGVFDYGIQTMKSIIKLKRGTEAYLAGGTDERSNSNGSLMRVLPLALWHKGTDLELINDAFAQSQVTHGHLRTQLCCALYCLWARNILNETENAWEKAVEIIRHEFAENTIERNEFESKIQPDELHSPGGSGYVVDSLFSTRWALEEGGYEQVVKSAVSLGDDTDTTACIAGGLAGVRDGIESIPVRWRESLRGKDIYEPLLEKLIEFADS